VVCVGEMKINANQCGIEIVNGNRQNNGNRQDNTNGNRQVCGTKINMGNEK